MTETHPDRRPMTPEEQAFMDGLPQRLRTYATFPVVRLEMSNAAARRIASDIETGRAARRSAALARARLVEFEAEAAEMVAKNDARIAEVNATIDGLAESQRRFLRNAAWRAAQCSVLGLLAGMLLGAAIASGAAP